MASQEPSEGACASATFPVTSADLASAGSPDSNDRFPKVLATARLVAMMEIASARVLQPYLGTGQLSVGVRIDATHSAPTPEGESVTAEATFTGKEGKLFVFRVVARDTAGEIGTARHERAIVDVARLEAAASKRRISKA